MTTTNTSRGAEPPRRDAPSPRPDAAVNPWAALWALCLGFFMILVDSTIVSVAIPSMMAGLHAGINEVLWVTSAYLLAYAVPLLITGRLGDRFGPKALYQTGLVLFTVSSAWCGLSGSIGMLITARVRSIADHTVTVPPVLISLVDPSGVVVYEWTVTLKAAKQTAHH